LKLESEIQGKEQDNFNQLTDWVRVIMSIKSVYSDYCGIKNDYDTGEHDADNTKNIMFRLS